MTFSYVNKLKLFLFALVFILFANTITHDFAWDDSIVITENARVQKGISGIPDLFFKYNSDYKADKYGYRPITLTSFALEYKISKANPHLMHFMNVFYFALLCIIIFNVLSKLFSNYSVFFPFIITILFIVHPLHTEVVANIKSRDEIFAMLFSFLALNQIINFHNHQKLKHLVFAPCFFILAFLSKESAVVFLAIIPITLLYLTNWRNIKSIIKPTLVIIPLLFICFGIVSYYTKSSLGIASSKGAGIYYESGILGNSFFYVDVLASRLADAFLLLMLYMKNFFWPSSLFYFYGYNQVPVASWGQPLVVISFLLNLALFAFAIIYRKKYKEISYGILFYFFTIFIYTHLLRTLADTMADRFMFVPSLGLIIAFVFTISRLFKVNLETIEIKNLLSLKTKIPGNVTKLKYLFLVIIVVLSMVTYSRNKVWKNNETLISHDMPSLENCARAHNYYADILKTKLSTSFDANKETEMISHYKKSIAISNESYYSFLGLGTYYIGSKKYTEALSVFSDMIKKFPDQADPNFYLGQALYYTGNYKDAKGYLGKSLILAPEVSNTYYFLGLTLSKTSEFDKALSIINEEKQKFGESAYVYDALGTIYFEKNDLDLSTKATFELLRFGADPKTIYGTVIGRYQTKKLDKPAAYYYTMALEKGVFQKQ